MNTTIETLTSQMHQLETEITRQQAYIAKYGDANDANTDAQWESYKQNAQYNLDKWDFLKSQRDRAKQEEAHQCTINIEYDEIENLFIVRMPGVDATDEKAFIFKSKRKAVKFADMLASEGQVAQ